MHRYLLVRTGLSLNSLPASEGSRATREVWALVKSVIECALPCSQLTGVATFRTVGLFQSLGAEWLSALV
jgi:hypothetical protein